MADKSIGDLPQLSQLQDDSLLVVEQNGAANKLPGSMFKQFAKDNVAEYVEGAKESAENAALSALVAAESASTAAQSEAKAATSEKNAAASENAAASSAAQAKYIADNAAAEAAAGVENRLSDYVNDAEAAMAGAEAAQAAAEKARDEAGAIVGSDFATKSEAQGYVITHNTDASAHADIRTLANNAQTAANAALPKNGGTLTGTLKGTDAEFSGMIRNTIALNVLNAKTNDVIDEFVIKTKIPFTAAGYYLPCVRLFGMAYGKRAPVEMTLVFYPYSTGMHFATCISKCSWKPKIYASTYIDETDGKEYCALSFFGNIYLLGFIVDYYDLWKGTTAAAGWTVETNNITTTGVSIIPQEKIKEFTYDPIANDISGNAATATKLATAIKINGIAFDGTQNIALTAANVGAIARGGSLTAGADLNTVLTGGMYRLQTGHINAPTNSAFGQLLVVHGGSDTIAQVVFCHNVSRVWHRNGQFDASAGTSTWSEWAQFSTASEMNTAINRTTAVNAADTNYTTLMARGSSLNSAETTPAVNGAIAWTYK